MSSCDVQISGQVYPLTRQTLRMIGFIFGIVDVSAIPSQKMIDAVCGGVTVHGPGQTCSEIRSLRARPGIYAG